MAKAMVVGLALATATAFTLGSFFTATARADDQPKPPAAEQQAAATAKQPDTNTLPAAESSECTDEKTQRLITIPVFFISDRNRQPCKDKDNLVKFGNLRQYRGTCNHDPHLGVAYCTITNTQEKPLDKKLVDLGWKDEHKRGEGAYSVSLIEGCTYDEATEKFFDDIHKQASNTCDQELFVFAPGYMSTFESGVREAARFAYYSERPVLLYSWASKGTFKGYSSDEASIEWSQEHYNDLIGELNGLASRKPAVSVRLFAHSMGSRLIVRAAPLIKGRDTFKEISLVCPDIDDGLVKHYISRCMTNDGKTTIRLYMSHKDRMLALSKLVHGGYARLGQDQELIPASPYKASDSCSGKPTIETLKRFQTIDFTELDFGKLGHKIPVALVCSLSQTGKPPEGIELIHKKGKDADCSEIMLTVSDIDDDEAQNLLGYFLAHRCEGAKFPVANAVKKGLPKVPGIKKDWTIK
ncbi:MAG: alpha/beta hydrolase [Candidatus Obscuribacterales bacterium]